MNICSIQFRVYWLSDASDGSPYSQPHHEDYYGEREGKETPSVKGSCPRKMTAMLLSAREVAEKTGRECKMSQFQDPAKDRPRHFRLGQLRGFGFFFGTLKVEGE
jgi:hypothetical protein